MVKKITALCAAALAAAVIGLSASAQAAVKIHDNAEILDPYEEKRITEQIERLVLDHGVDAVVYTTQSFGGIAPAEYEKQVFEETGCGAGEERDGLVILLSVGETGKKKECYIGRHGWADGKGITQYGAERISALIYQKLKAGDYAGCCEYFLELSDEFLKAGKKGRPYSEDRVYRTGGDYLRIILLWAAAGLAAGAGVCLPFMRLMRKKAAAQASVSYIKMDTLKISRQRDILLYTKTTRTPRGNKESAGSTDASA